MITLITGGSASGKSEFAEKYTAERGGRLIYAATMHNDGSRELRERIEKHRVQRAGYGFATLEQETDIGDLVLRKGDTLLVECMSNLLANEMYGKGLPAEEACRKLRSDILKLADSCGELVLVTNEVFSDGCDYGNGLLPYIDALALLNCQLAGISDTVIEVVYSIPLILKGESL